MEFYKKNNNNKSIVNRLAEMILWKASRIKSLFWLKPAKDSFPTANKSQTRPCRVYLLFLAHSAYIHSLLPDPHTCWTCACLECLSCLQPGMLFPHVSTWLTPSPLYLTNLSFSMRSSMRSSSISSNRCPEIFFQELGIISLDMQFLLVL